MNIIFVIIIFPTMFAHFYFGLICVNTLDSRLSNENLIIETLLAHLPELFRKVTNFL
jgi:hypothetical protein